MKYFNYTVIVFSLLITQSLYGKTSQEEQCKEIVKSKIMDAEYPQGINQCNKALKIVVEKMHIVMKSKKNMMYCFELYSDNKKQNECVKKPINQVLKLHKSMLANLPNKNSMCDQLVMEEMRNYSGRIDPDVLSAKRKKSCLSMENYGVRYLYKKIAKRKSNTDTFMKTGMDVFKPATGNFVTSIVGYNHNDEYIHVFYLNGVMGSNIPAHGGGGGTTCCAELPQQWHSGLKAIVKWSTTSSDRKTTWHKKLVPLPKYSTKGVIVQVHFLNNLKSLSCKQLHNMLTLIAPSSQISSEHIAIDARPPWENGAKIKPIKIENCPEQITVTLANHIYFKLNEIPAPLAARLKRLASFSNPVFFKTQALRFSTHNIPRYISCARIEQGPGNLKWLSLPRGCFDDAVALLEKHNITAVIEDKREHGEKIKSLKFLGKLRKDQSKAVTVLTKYDTGILHAPTAFGKTVAAIGIIAKRKTNTLILTHSRQLLDQWQERLKSFLPETEIGVIGGGKKKPSGQIDVATYQSLINKKDNSIDPLIQDYGQIIIDECHHISAPRFEMVLNEVRAKYVLGLTATPDRQDGQQKIIFMLAGPIRHKVASNHSDKFEQHVVVKKLYNQPPLKLMNGEKRPRISDVYQWLCQDESRSQNIVADVVDEIAKGKHPLILTERREHAVLINQLLLEKKIHSVILRGAMRAKERNAASEQLPNAQAVVATGKYIGEGFDLPRLDTLFLAMPIAWKGSLAQYAGRIHRESAGKDKVTIFDYVDASLPMLQRMFNKREKGYKAMGYQITL